MHLARNSNSISITAVPTLSQKRHGSSDSKYLALQIECRLTIVRTKATNVLSATQKGTVMHLKVVCSRLVQYFIYRIQMSVRPPAMNTTAIRTRLTAHHSPSCHKHSNESACSGTRISSDLEAGWEVLSEAVLDVLCGRFEEVLVPLLFCLVQVPLERIASACLEGGSEILVPSHECRKFATSILEILNTVDIRGRWGRCGHWSGSLGGAAA